MSSEWNADPRNADSRLREARKQLELARERIEDETLVEELAGTIETVENVRSQVSFTDDSR